MPSLLSHQWYLTCPLGILLVPAGAGTSASNVPTLVLVAAYPVMQSVPHTPLSSKASSVSQGATDLHLSPLKPCRLYFPPGLDSVSYRHYYSIFELLMYYNKFL